MVAAFDRFDVVDTVAFRGVLGCLGVQDDILWARILYSVI